MDPFTLISLVAGGLSAVGSFMGTQSASQASAINKNIAGLEENINDQHRKAMEIDARRRQMDIIRTNQKAKAMSLAGATNQGASFGSGLAGGQAEVAGQSGVNLLGVDQNLNIGRSIFDINSSISQQRINLADVQGQEATASGIS